MDPIVNERQIQAPEEVNAMMSLENLIKNHVTSIDKLKLELKQHNEMFKDSFNNNPTFREHDEKVKDATKTRNAIKMQIVKQPSVALLEQKVKDLKFDLNEKQKTLSDLTLDYHQQTGATQLSLDNDMVLDIVLGAKLVGKRR